jgi:hypothetical protein
VSAHFARYGKARLDDLRAAEVGTSDQRNHARGRDGRGAVILHRMWIDGTEFNWSKKEAAA